MNKNIKLAVAGAIFAAASAAQAGIVIPAGDWTLDVSGNVNAYNIYSQSKGTATVAGGLSGAGTATKDVTTSGMQNGLLPNFLSIGASTRQNDLDVAFVISLQPGTGATNSLAQVGSAGNAGLNNRQAFMTFGDKSWGSVKLGKDLGVFASDAILNDMTLLGVGATLGGSTSAGNTTLGRIGTGYIYAEWKPQITYTTPNMSGFQATVGISQAMTAGSLANSTLTATSTIDANGVVSAGASTGRILSKTGAAQSNPAYEGKISYSFAANDVTGKVWVSGLAQRAGVSANDEKTVYVGDIGANVNAAGFGLTGYYYAGQGIGTTGQMLDGYSAFNGNARDSDGGYVQATYVLPTKTKVGVSWGISNLDLASGENNTVASYSSSTVASASAGVLVKENEMWTAGIYHPLTKHLNLVGEYSHLKSTNQANAENKTNVGSVGAILFF
ncbi:porin [Candidatus Methylopumilus universalis]|uniref:porin n=1 Tax=Candidatus Methylopumilus universalis TaxID=2588536 RepID=UPI00111FFDF7|nr:porin [Candidatus Methylopumilus universalis]QDC76263.1 porin [Candidatus Methylopumilus universalis]